MFDVKRKKTLLNILRARLSLSSFGGFSLSLSLTVCCVLYTRLQMRAYTFNVPMYWYCFGAPIALVCKLSRWEGVGEQTKRKGVTVITGRAVRALVVDGTHACASDVGRRSVYV